MSKVIKSRHSSHRWRNKTRCRIEGREDNGVTYLTTLAEGQSQKLLMHYHVHRSLVRQICLCSNKSGHLLFQNIAHVVFIWVLSLFQNTYRSSSINI